MLRVNHRNSISIDGFNITFVYYLIILCLVDQSASLSPIKNTSYADIARKKASEDVNFFITTADDRLVIQRKSSD